MGNIYARSFLKSVFQVNDAQIVEWARREPYIRYMLNAPLLKDKEDFTTILGNLCERRGKKQDVAALYLGITPDSFKVLLDAKFIRPLCFEESEYYLEYVLDEFMSRYIERNLLFSNLTNQRLYFIEKFNKINATVAMKLRPEMCAFNDEHIAAEICINPDCDRRMCLAHGIFVETKKPSYSRPDEVCARCAKEELSLPRQRRHFKFMRGDEDAKAWLRRLSTTRPSSNGRS